ncbi:MAG: DUF2723 domain-containing protein [Chitinophagaceae bacterium]|nr:DUF2723 domain-containing protein [Chitinophagaceae bacterium]
MSFKKINNLTGWAVFAIAFMTYFLTREARGSLWDTGEFIACADTLGLPHPPGAPLFVILGRVFIILFGGSNPAGAVNLLSAAASAFTILFLFWSITHFARKLYVSAGEALTSTQLFNVMAAGVVGSLAYTFTDSFWFSAVEGEVYALSSFFTALVFWAMLKWEHADEHSKNDPERARADRWLIFIFFMMGLSIGVHLLNLLVIPAIVMIYYFRRFKPTLKGSIIAFLIGCLIVGLIQVVVIKYSMKAAGQFDVFFTNTLGLPFFYGFAIYFIAVAALIYVGLKFQPVNLSRTRLMIWFLAFAFISALPLIVVPGQGLKFFLFLLLGGAAVAAGYYFKPSALRILRISLWGYAFMLLGYLVYLTTLIRSNANPAIDMNNVDNPINLVYYLSREQYGEAPLLYGPHFAADYLPDPESPNGIAMKKGEMKYVKGKTKYIPIGTEDKPRYAPEDMQLFPRIWDSSNDQFHADFYIEWLGLDNTENASPDKITEFPRGSGQQIRKPGYADNIRWLFTYQLGLMYWRYFMWNFSGRQNDIQGFGNKRDGNWITGISFIDNKRLGDQSRLPEALRRNKANNKLYLLPFLFGILGCIYHFFKNRKDWVVNFLLFFFTGIAIVLYLNQPGNQPRERDYAYVGSFYAFAIWIGLAVVAIHRLAKEKADQITWKNTLLYGSALTFVITFFSCINDTASALLMVSVMAAALYALLTTGIIYAVRAVSSGGNHEKLLNLSSALIGLLVPVLMAQQEWDDHDRSNKTTALDLARNYLESCAPNAILFTFGDNDTYPLWYAQEVEGIRRDVRVINNSLLGIDWYINQLRYKVNDADSLDVIWSPEQIEGHNREYMRFRQEGDPNTYYDLYDAMKNVLGRTNIDPDTKRDIGYGSFPVAKFKVPVDTALVKQNGTVRPGDSLITEMRFEIPQEKLNMGLIRSDFIILNIIATNRWKRPIYFTSPYGELGFGPYLRKEGMCYRLVPAVAKSPEEKWVAHQALRNVGLRGTSLRDMNTDWVYEVVSKKFTLGRSAEKDIYYDEENRRHMLSIRNAIAEAAGVLADEGKLKEAAELIDKAEKGISSRSLPYAMPSRYNSHNQQTLVYLEACYKAGKTELAEKVRQSLRKDLEQQRAYYVALNQGNPPNLNNPDDNHPHFTNMILEYRINEAMLTALDEIEKKYAPQAKSKTENGAPPASSKKDTTVKKDTTK